LRPDPFGEAVMAADSIVQQFLMANYPDKE